MGNGRSMAGHVSQRASAVAALQVAVDERHRIETSTPTLPRLAQGHQMNVDQFITHHFTLDQFEEAYDVFSRAAETGALKVVLTRA